MTTATITHASLNSGIALNLICSAVTPAIKCTNSAVAADNKSFGLVPVQTKGIENPKIVISGLQLRHDQSNVFNETHLLQLAQLNYDDTNAAVLNVTYGTNTTSTYKNTLEIETTGTSLEALVKTLTVNNTVPELKYNVKVTSGSVDVRVLFTYDDASDEEVTESGIIDTSYIQRTAANPELSKTVTNIKFYVTPSAAPITVTTGTISTYHTEGERSLSLLGGSTDIKVVYETSSIPIDVTASKDGDVPVINLTLTETA